MTIQRVKPSEQLIKESIAHLSQAIDGEFHAKLEAAKRRAELFDAALAPVRSIVERDAKAGAALTSLKKLADDERRAKDLSAEKATKARAGRQFFLQVNPGLNILVPPYDAQWTNSIVGGSADQNAGTFQATALDTLSYGAAGLGVFLTSSETVNARLSADMEYNYNWVDWSNPSFSYTATSGGVGVLISGEGGVVDQRAELWNDVDIVGAHTGSSGGYLAETQAGQNYFLMEANATYVAWIWCWTTAAITGNSSLSGGTMQCNMPFIVVED